MGVVWRALGDPRTLISSGGTVIFKNLILNSSNLGVVFVVIECRLDALNF